jgi:ADP-ribosylglycohydrolase
MMTREELLRDRQAYHEKALGCLMGLAVGDALGDLGRNDAARQRYGIVTNLYGDAGSTDDTEFALLTAKTLIESEGELTREALFASWQRHILAQGGVYDRGGKPLYGAVANLQRGLRPPLSGRFNVNNDDDGAAMRIAPIGVFAAGDARRAAELARVEAEISHHEDGVWAAQAVAASIAVAMVDGSVAEIVAAGLEQVPVESWLGHAMHKAMDICDEANAVEDAWEALHEEFWTPTHSMSAEALPQAYALFRLTDGDFRKAMFWGGNFGRDADTIGAVLGALCGALHGASVIPKPWFEKARQPSGVCLKFAAHEDIPEITAALVDLVYRGRT